MNECYFCTRDLARGHWPLCPVLDMSRARRQTYFGVGVALKHRLPGRRRPGMSAPILSVAPREAMTLSIDAMREAWERVREASGPRPQYLLLHPNDYYDALVRLRDPRWLAMPFRVVRGESRGETDERWRRRRAFIRASA